MKREVIATYTWEDGYWTGRAPVSEHGAAITQGRSVRTVKARMLDAVASILDCEESEVELVHTFELPPRARKRLAEVGRSRSALDRAKAASVAATVSAAQALTEAGISRRDAGEVLGVSGQWVDQLLKA